MSFSVHVLKPWNGVAYGQAIAEQRKLASEGRVGWFFFCCPPTITLGRRGHFSDVLMPMDELKRLGVRLLPVDRGGQVTFHGPGQIIGFPYGRLEAHTGDPRGVRAFVRGLEAALEAFIRSELKRLGDDRVVLAGHCGEGAGVWLKDHGIARKVAAMGLSFGKGGIAHGFALNVQPMDEGFSLVNPCGEIGARSAALFRERRPADELATVREHLKGYLNATIGAMVS